MSIRDAVPEDLERASIAVRDEVAVEMAPPPPLPGPWGWARRNLFSTWLNGALTVIVAGLLVYVSFRLVRFVFVTADWTVLKVNLRSYMIGRFPLEQAWRVWAVVFLLASVAGVTRGVLPPVSRTKGQVAVAGVVGLLLVGALRYLLESALVWILLGVAIALFGVGVVAGRRIPSGRRGLVLGSWVAVVPVVLALLSLGPVHTDQWGGLLLNVTIAVVAIGLSFPLGLLLALGRRSSLPAVSTFCVGFIELVRGVPLVTLLIFGRFVLILLLPPGLTLAQLTRATFMFTIFSAAYVAEIVRGGLQGVPEGQYEASRALGLSTTRTMQLIALPQALRSTIPPMVGHFISVFKDTSLLAALGFSELLFRASNATRALAFVGNTAEAILPAALMFWVIAFSLSRWSQRLEVRLGLGTR
jgi:general L-amino acid transport system permease protein